MTEERLEPVLRSWLRNRAVPPPDSTQTAAHVLARLPRVRQRGRWWRLPQLRHRSDMAAPSAVGQPLVRGLPIDHIPIVTRRTVTMLSPVKAILAGALVALGGLFLVAQPLGHDGGGVPGAQTAESATAAVTVTQDCENIYASPIICTWTATDPRLAGTMSHVWAVEISPPEPDDQTSFGWADATLEGPEGSWSGHLYAVWGAEPASQLFAVFSGAGAYEGWQFVASTIDDGEEVADSDWYGVAYKGEPPPFGPPSAPAVD